MNFQAKVKERSHREEKTRSQGVDFQAKVKERSHQGRKGAITGNEFHIDARSLLVMELSTA